MNRPFHLGFFTSFAPDEWNGPLSSGGGDFWTGEFFVELAQSLERACFDFVLLEDSLAIPETFGGSRDHYLRHAFISPKHDPVPMCAVMGSHTRNLGLVATMSTAFYPPYMLARLASTVDSMTHGRFGWNMVTSTGDGVPENFGIKQLEDHDVRYDIADDSVAAAEALWRSWEEGAVVRDHDTGTYVDGSKVHRADYVGQYYSTRGPLNTVRSPQGKPVLVQAGASDRGREFAARHAECIVATARGVTGMKAYRDDIRARMERMGRNPDDCKVLFLVTPIVGRTDQDAETWCRSILETERYQLDMLSRLSAYTDHDLSVYDLDEPLPHIESEGSLGLLSRLAQWGSGKPLRQCIIEMGFASDCMDLVGSAETVAGQMCDAIDEIGGDGFLISSPGFQPSRIHTISITDGLIPVLQRWDRVRTEYAGATLRENLLSF